MPAINRRVRTGALAILAGVSVVIEAEAKLNLN